MTFNEYLRRGPVASPAFMEGVENAAVQERGIFDSGLSETEQKQESGNLDVDEEN
jgi:hypothetical protein